VPITVTLGDGKQIEGTAWETTPLQIARGISTSLADRIIIAKVNNQELWDLNRPLEASVTLSLLDFDSPENNYEARQVFWHSSAHVMGEACERRFDGCCLGYGPPIEEGGFFYDMALGGGKTLSQDDYKQIEDVCKIAVKEKQPFERLELPKEVLLEMFKASGTLCTPSASADCRSTTSTSNTTSTTRSLTGRLPPSTDADLSSISVLVPTCPTPAASSPSP
jgi:threonyl-tRNA synthetase